MIRGLQPSMTYQFYVVAQNARGTSAPSEVLQVTTLIEVSQALREQLRSKRHYPIYFCC